MTPKWGSHWPHGGRPFVGRFESSYESYVLLANVSSLAFAPSRLEPNERLPVPTSEARRAGVCAVEAQLGRPLDCMKDIRSFFSGGRRGEQSASRSDTTVQNARGRGRGRSRGRSRGHGLRAPQQSTCSGMNSGSTGGSGSETKLQAVGSSTQRSGSCGRRNTRGRGFSRKRGRPPPVCQRDGYTLDKCPSCLNPALKMRCTGDQEVSAAQSM